MKENRGGKRVGAGRKRILSKGIAHTERESLFRRTPCHVNFKYRAQIRNKPCLKLLRRGILNARKQGLRILHYSIQTNHIHLIIEADDNFILSSGMRALTITFAKGLKMGRVQIERYHLHVLKGVRETRNAIFYVLFNRQKHEKEKLSRIDSYTSLLSLENGIDLIKAYVNKKKVMLKIWEVDKWPVDFPKSWSALKAIKNPSY